MPLNIWLKNFNRTSRLDVFYEIGVLNYFAKFTGKHLHQSLFFNKVARLRRLKRIWHSCFPLNFVKCLRTHFLQNTSGGCFCVGGSLKQIAFTRDFI